MIPKVVHYVWVGGKDKPKSILKCIDSWKKNLPEFQFREWNEHNFPLEKFPFAKRAFEERQWAFVSDLIRAAVIYEYGGVYLDTDVKVIKDLSGFLKNRAFVGFQDKEHPFTATFGAEPKHPLLKNVLDFYDSIPINDSFNFKEFVNTEIFSDILINTFNCNPDGKEQILSSDIHVFPSGFLCYPSFHSTTVHVFLGSWLKDEGTLFSRLKERWRLSLSNRFQCGLYSMFMIIVYRCILRKDDHRR